MKTTLAAMLFLLTVASGQDRLYTSLQLGAMDWVGFVPEEKRTKATGLFLSAEMKWEFHSAVNVGIGALVAQEWCIPFGCGYNPDNFNQMTFAEVGWVWKKWKIETDTGPFLGVAYKSGPSRKKEDDNGNSGGRCLPSCIPEDVDAETETAIEWNPGLYFSIVYNIKNFVIGIKQRYYLDHGRILDAAGIYFGGRMKLF